jgi:outer membrane immunogenic protein
MGAGVDQPKVKKALLLASVSPVALAFGGHATNAQPSSLGMSPAVAYSWTGCFVGGTVGYGWGRQNPSETSKSTHTSCCSGTTTQTGMASGPIDSSGGLYGGQGGCNFQFAPSMVVGVQGDLYGAHIHGTGADPWNPQTFGSGDGTIGVTTNWIASITGRFGFTGFSNMVLFYAKGGVAWDQNTWNLANSDLFSALGSVHETRTGWTTGAGVEWAFAAPWTVFLEWDYYGFHNGNTYSTSAGTTSSVLNTGPQTINAVLLGFNYKWGPPP